MKIDEKHRLFVEAYSGDTVLAMRTAGYEGPDSFLKRRGDELLATPLIQEALEQRGRYMASTVKVIADKEEAQVWWTHIMRNEDPHAKPEVDKDGITRPAPGKEVGLPISVRMKASEYLAKSHGAFIEKIDINHKITITDLVRKAYTVDDDDLDAIEAEYTRLRSESAPAPIEPSKADELPVDVIPPPAYPEEQPKFRLEDFI